MKDEKPVCKIYDDGSKIWFIRGLPHRVDGPAMELANGTKKWCINGKLHREDGPAVTDNTGAQFWYFNNRIETKEQHTRLVKLKAFL